MQYRDPATRAHVPRQQGHPFVGTPTFTSINHHLGIQSSQRDNLESLAYMLIYLLQGSLPWVSNDNSTIDNHAILSMKQDITTDKLCDGLPHKFVTFLDYPRSLSYAAKPNYGYLRSLLHNCVVTPSHIGHLIAFSWLTDDEPCLLYLRMHPNILVPLQHTRQCQSERHNKLTCKRPAAAMVVTPSCPSN